MDRIIFFEKLSEKNKQQLMECTETKVLAKGELIHLTDNKPIFVCIIHSGIVRSYFVQSGKDVTTMFCFKNEICIPNIIDVSAGNSTDYMEAITHQTEVSLVDLSKFEKLKTRNKEFLELEVSIYKAMVKKLAARFMELQTMDANQRYLQLLEKEPDITKLVSLTHIALYLGIKLGSLSRIRSITK